ncbi:MAG TPA: carboxypeptidase-like regulatory domain-containing protein [Kofleriaceae bacterium]
MRFVILLLALSVAACGPKKPGADDDDDGDGGSEPDACVGLECQVVNCAAMGMPPTTITGTVYAPNGTLPLNGVNVYVPRDPLPLPPFTEGASCDRCALLPGGPVAQVISGENGSFTLENVPAGANVPIVITTGKWRRVVTLSNVNQCTDNVVTVEQSRLPKTKAEGDIPKIALTTGGADSLECLVRKLGVDDTEISTNAGTGRVNFFVGDESAFDAVGQFQPGHPGGPGQTFPAASGLWDSADKLKVYDIVFLSCEGSQNEGSKPQPSIDAMKAYADLGGRVFASHWHNIWIGGNYTGDNNPSPAVWRDIAEWNGGSNLGGTIYIDEAANPKGTAFANWMVNVGGSTTRGEIVLQSGTGRLTASSVDPLMGEQWVRTSNNNPQMFQFTTPNEQPLDQRCGKVVFTDMHVSGDPADSGRFPDCGGNTLTPQEKALAFMFFDIASCVGGID